MEMTGHAPSLNGCPMVPDGARSETIGHPDKTPGQTPQTPPRVPDGARCMQSVTLIRTRKGLDAAQPGTGHPTPWQQP